MVISDKAIYRKLNCIYIPHSFENALSILCILSYTYSSIQILLARVLLAIFSILSFVFI